MAAARHRRLSLRACSAVALGLAAPLAQAAAYLPGVEADPPTGDSVGPAAAEPPREADGSGIEWRFAPVRWSGSVAVDLRWLRLEDGSARQQVATQIGISGATYVWQPWFLQLRFGGGLFGSRDTSARAAGSGAADAPPSTGRGVVGDVAVSVFPASRFPFEASAGIADSRSSGESLGNEQRTHRWSLSQGWRPLGGNDNYSLRIDGSHAFADDTGRDSVLVVDGAALLDRGPHRWALHATRAENHRGDGSDRTLNSTLSARYGWHPGSGLDIDSLASWHRNDTDGAFAGEGGGLSTELLQLSTLGTWRPGKDGQPFGLPATTQYVGSARWLTQSVGNGDADARASAFSATAGLTTEVGSAWRFGASASASQFDSGGGAPSRSISANGVVGWSPPSLGFAGWRWTPSAAASAGVTRGSGDNDLSTAGLQLGHALSRDWLLGERDALAISATQSAGVQVAQASEEDTRNRTLSHGLALSWQRSGDSGRQHFASLSASDSRSFGNDPSTFQLVNLQWTERNQTSRLSAWSGSATLQMTRTRTPTDAAAGAAAAPLRDSGWQRFANLSLSYTHQRFFGVPRLRFTAAAGYSTQQFDRRRDGEVDAPLSNVSRSLEARLDYAIGRLDARLAVRAARVDERSVASVIARVQRRF